MRIKLLTFLLYIISSTVSSAANISIRNNENDCIGSSPIIVGNIESGDLIKFKSIVSSLKKKYGEKECSEGHTFVHINSDGGDIEESLLIGREIRKNSFGVIVQQNSNCLSSCVFILASGVDKFAFGKIGIHRPYFSTVQKGKSTDEIRAMRDSINKQIKNYLNYVDVPEHLLDEMLAIPPEKMKILSENELIKFRLQGKDGTQDEVDTAKSASFYNLSSLEYRKRQSDSLVKCRHLLDMKNGSSNFIRCNDAVILKISENESQVRHNKADSFCSNIKNIYEKLDCVKRIVVENN